MPNPEPLIPGLVLAIVCAVGLAAPGVENPARTNFMLHCMGCHGPDGGGTPTGGVPSLRGSVGTFARLSEGRAFLVQVPGVANAPLDAAALAELLNWMLDEYSAAELPADFVPFTAAEVTVLRRTPVENVPATRAALLKRLRAAGLPSLPP